MKIVVIGGTGLIGSKTVAILREEGHEVVAGSPKSGVNSITGKGLKEAMAGGFDQLDCPTAGQRRRHDWSQCCRGRCRDDRELSA